MSSGTHENKDDVQDNHLFHRTNRQSISACVTWKGPTNPFCECANDKCFKVNSTHKNTPGKMASSQSYLYYE